MKDNIMFNCHFHYYGDDVGKLKKNIESSVFGQKYLCYHCVNYEHVEMERNITEKCIYFMIPFVIKETNITKANTRLKIFSNQYENVMQVPLLGDVYQNYIGFERLIGFKEHFLLHNIEDFSKREAFYEFLNRNGLLLILHCKDVERLEYVKKLRAKYPNMYIQIAHLGVDRKNMDNTRTILSTLKEDSHVYYDISTVYDYDFIKETSPAICHQLLFGTDRPYVSSENFKQQRVYFAEELAPLLTCMNKNAQYLLGEIEKNKKNSNVFW